MTTETNPVTPGPLAVGATREAASAAFGARYDALTVVDYAEIADGVDTTAVSTLAIAAGEGMRPTLEAAVVALAAGGSPRVLVEYPRDTPSRSIVRDVLGAHAVTIVGVDSQDGRTVLELARSDSRTPAALFEALDVGSPSPPRSPTGPRAETTTEARSVREFLRPLAGAVVVGLVLLVVVLVLVGRSGAGATGVVIVLVLALLAEVAALGVGLTWAVLRLRRDVLHQGELLRRTRSLLDRRTQRVLKSYRSPELRNPDLAVIRRYVAEIAAENARGQVRQQQLHLETQRQVQADLNLQQMVSTPARVPPMGGWAASPDLMVLILDELLRLRPATVVECGSGTSTLLLALTVQQHGLDTRVVALEHLEQFREQTERTLVRHGVADRAEVRLAPLEQSGVEGHSTPWYAASALEDLDQIGVLVIDGPPTTTGDLARYPAIPLLREKLAPDAVVILDDLVRDSDSEVADRWRALLPDFEFEVLNTLQKKTGVFRRDQTVLRSRPSQ
jgi:predicted O-methyltransferase YrrM